MRYSPHVYAPGECVFSSRIEQRGRKKRRVPERQQRSSGNLKADGTRNTVIRVSDKRDPLTDVFAIGKRAWIPLTGLPCKNYAWTHGTKAAV